MEDLISHVKELPFLTFNQYRNIIYGGDVWLHFTIFTLTAEQKIIFQIVNRQQRKIEYVLDIKEKEDGECTCRVDGGKKLSEFKKCFSWENVVLAAVVVCARGQPASPAGAEEKGTMLPAAILIAGCPLAVVSPQSLETSKLEVVMWRESPFFFTAAASNNSSKV